MIGMILAAIFAIAGLVVIILNNLHSHKMTHYIVRSDRAGVFVGNIKSRKGSEVTMTNVRRVWYWDGAASLSQMAMEGVKRPNNCKFTVTVTEMTILGVIEIIPCEEEAKRNIKAVPVWKM